MNLLRTFAHLGVRSAGAMTNTPAPDADELLTTQQLRARGWTPAVIARLLPEPDATRPNRRTVGWSRQRLAAPVQLYTLARVEAAEATDAYRVASAAASQRQAAAAKGVATRTERERAYVAGYAPHLPTGPAQLSGPRLWDYHLQELLRYESAHWEEYAAIPTSQQPRASRQLYQKHQDAFNAKFGDLS